MRYLISLLILSIVLPVPAQSTSELPFQVLVAEKASIYGTPVEPLQMVDDVTSIDIEAGGFLSLVHKGGTTYEHTEKIFTFYLKPEELKNRQDRPQLSVLYQDSSNVEPIKNITVLHPAFDRSGYLEWTESKPFDLYWNLQDGPVLSYVLSVSDGRGNKIQDFRTKLNAYTLKPNTYGLSDGLFSFKISSSFAGETVESKTYTVQLKPAPDYSIKATDLIIKAMDLELIPVMALTVWKDALNMPNGQFYRPLYEKFLKRNEKSLSASGEDVQLLLSQSK